MEEMKCTKTMGRTRVCICVYTVWSNMGKDKGVERGGRRGVMYIRTYDSYIDKWIWYWISGKG